MGAALCARRECNTSNREITTFYPCLPGRNAGCAIMSQITVRELNMACNPWKSPVLFWKNPFRWVQVKRESKMDNETRFPPLTPCPECGGERVIAPCSEGVNLVLTLFSTVPLQALTCMVCGHTTLYATEPQKLKKLLYGE